jgi:signal peptidase I
MNHKGKLFIVLLVLIALAVLIIYASKPNFITDWANCNFTSEEYTVRGDSLQGIVEDGQIVKVFPEYYDCYEIKRGDMIVYSYAGNSEPVIKIIKGIPGDRFELRESGSGWNILINEQVLMSSDNQPYLLDVKGYNMLSLYERDYNGVIPENAYLILGNLAGGSVDSTRYGLVSRDDILGKVKY